MHNPVLLKLVTQGPALLRLSFYGVSVQCFRRLSSSLRLQIPSSTLTSLQALEVTFRSSISHISDYDFTMAMQPFGSAITSLSLSLPWKDECGSAWSNAAQVPVAIPPRILNNITHLAIEFDWNVEFLINILQQCVSLERLEVNTCSAFTLRDAEQLLEPFDWHSDLPVIRLPKLHTMRLSGQHPRIILLRRLIAPSLQSLHLSFDLPELSRHLYAGTGWCGFSDDDEEEDPWDAAAERLKADASLLSQPLLPFLQRSNCLSTLRSLHLAGRELPSEELLVTLGQMPALTHLALERVATNYEALLSSLQLQSIQRLELRSSEAMSSAEIKALTKFLKRHPHASLSNGHTSCFLRDQANLATFMSAQVCNTDIDAEVDRLEPRPPPVYSPFFD